MIDFALDGIHPSYDRLVRDVIRGLDADYPLDAVTRVELYGKSGDESMGCMVQPGIIRLNRRWFSRPLDELRDAARADDLVHLGGWSTVIQWHGGMEEPLHLLTHEFGHCLQDRMHDWREFADGHWQASCRDPIKHRPPSGYSLATPDEFWADSFAAYRLSYNTEAAHLMRGFLADCPHAGEGK